MNHSKLLIENIDKKLAIELLKYECELRKSNEIQDYYTFLDNSKGGRQEIVENFVQFKTIRDFGFKPNWDSLNNYRQISKKFQNDKEVENSAFYLKYNIMKLGNLNLGDIAPDVPLLYLDKSPCSLYDFKDETKPLVILSGSIS